MQSIPVEEEPAADGIEDGAKGRLSDAETRMTGERGHSVAPNERS